MCEVVNLELFKSNNHVIDFTRVYVYAYVCVQVHTSMCVSRGKRRASDVFFDHSLPFPFGEVSSLCDSEDYIY